MSFEKLFTALNAAFVFLFVFFLASGPITIDTLYSTDTLYLAHMGWRGLNGASPVIDYNHFYGGGTAWFMTKAFQLFGAQYKSVDYGLIMMFLTTALVTLALCWRRMHMAGIWLLLALSAALQLSLLLIETSAPIITISHAFVYNHMAIGLMLAMAVFTLCETEDRPEDRRIELAAAVIAGLAIYGLVLLKTAFGVMGIAVLGGLLIMGRWRSALVVAGSIVLGMLLMDPGMTRAIGAVRMFMHSGAAIIDSIWIWFIVATSKMLMSQLPIVLLTIVLGWTVFRAGVPKAGRMALAGLLCAGAYFGAMLNTNGDASLKLYPMGAILFLIGAQALRNEAAKSPVLGGLLRALPICLAYMLVLPGILNSIYVYIQARSFAEDTLADSGPMAGYHVLGEATRRPAARVEDVAARRAAALAYTDALLREDPDADTRHEDFTKRRLKAADEHALRMAGVALLETIPDVRQYGIVSNGQTFDFAAALFSKPVLSYSVWVNQKMPMMQDQLRLDDEIDMVMITPRQEGLWLVTEWLRPKMGDDFTPCKEVPYWTLYVRKGPLEDALCDS